MTEIKLYEMKSSKTTLSNINTVFLTEEPFLHLLSKIKPAVEIIALFRVVQLRSTDGSRIIYNTDLFLEIPEAKPFVTPHKKKPATV